MLVLILQNLVQNNLQLGDNRGDNISNCVDAALPRCTTSIAKSPIISSLLHDPRAYPPHQRTCTGSPSPKSLDTERGKMKGGG